MPWHTSDRRKRLPANWSALRAARLKLDGHRCTWIDRGERCTEPATDVDHRQAMTDDNRIEALRSLCRDHHARKSSAEGHRASAAQRKAQQARLRLPVAPHPGQKRRDLRKQGGG
ncbi:hypothetical protein ACFXG4_27215 [Nocardia sp. NPDC059246]|uniref:hypothetical protein n=1 Tax=unclassified Nocardia TaxID=2637762 RepID=UPI0036851EFB